MALAVVLLAGGGVIVRSFLNMYTAASGVNTENVISMQVSLPAARYSDSAAQIAFFDRLSRRLGAIPGVQSVATVDHVPMYGSGRTAYELDGAPADDPSRRPVLSAIVVSSAYFRTLGATLMSGRSFTETDGASGPEVAIVNQCFANEHWPGENPIGKRLRLFKGNTPEARTPEGWLTVTGLVSNVAQYGPSRPDLDSLIYIPYRERPASFMYVLVRTRVAAKSLEPTLRREAQTVDPDLPITNLMLLQERIAWTFTFNETIAGLFVIFAGIALLLASIGLYAVVAHSISRRIQEIGIRMALGATNRDIRKLVLHRGLLPVGLGLMIGLIASFAVNRLLKAELVRVSPNDPMTLTLSAAILLLAATLGCLIPARRATRVDPATTLRHE